MKITGSMNYVKFDLENGYVVKAEGEMLVGKKFVAYRDTMKFHLHIVPIDLVVFKGSYLIKSVGYLIFGSASRLDAFSVYPIRT